jgi:hypothetical protein
MKLNINKAKCGIAVIAYLGGCLCLFPTSLTAQDSTVAAIETAAPAKTKPVKNTFQSIWIIDNQTVLVPVKKTFEMDIQHRFGVVENGYEDFWGFFAPSNIRLGFSYVPIDKLSVGIGVTKTTAAVIPEASVSDVSGPTLGWQPEIFLFSLKQKVNSRLVLLTTAIFRTIPRKMKNMISILITQDRLTFFNQLIIARKVTEKLSVQVAPSLSHHNVVNGYYVKVNDSTLNTEPDMKFDHFAIALSARYKLTNVTSVMINYDQPITKHVSNNPNPSLSFGLEFNTSSHSFQVFATNYFYLVPQINNLYNSNSPFKYTDATGTEVKGGKFLIGFNITRLWNY